MENRAKGKSKPIRPANYDVIVVGAGAAGLTAAVALARKDFAVLVVEGAPFPGAENWSGCVFFAENLAHPDVLGPEGVAELAWERRLVERGVFLTNGHSLAGVAYRDPDAFRHCYTVLRPIFDRHLSEVARRLGVAILTDTTADGLIRDAGRVIGVSTQRGPLYAPLVFLAEGDASHLVTKEGYERRARTPAKPHFLQGVKQVIELPAEVIDERFGLARGEGAAYEFILRNGTLGGRPVTLNMGGFLYTNRDSVSLGFVLPLSKLGEGFEGNPHLLMEWIKGLPEIHRLIEGGKPGPFGAKLIRGGGEREVPYLIDHGLAVGGAASGIGTDFPYPNFTGPATAMGLLIAQAAERIREAGGSYSFDELNAHYVQPLRRSHYAADVRYLRSWPSYVERTQYFFGRNVDVVLATLYTWSRPGRGLGWKWWQWVRLLRTTMPFGKLGELRRDARRLVRTLDLPALARGVVGWQTLLHGTLNTLRDLTGSSRPRLAPSGQWKYVYTTADDPTGAGWPGLRPAGRAPVGLDHAPGHAALCPGHPAAPEGLPKAVVRWGERLRPVLAQAARHVYQNDATPLRRKLRGALETVFDQCNFLDLLASTGIVLAAALSIPVQALVDRIRFLIRRPTVEEFLASFARRYVEATKSSTALEGRAGAALTSSPPERGRDVGQAVPDASTESHVRHSLTYPSLAQDWEEKLSRLSYFSDERTHLLLQWPDRLEQRAQVAHDALWHLCPAHVYECHTDVTGSVRLVANYENCIKCESCWRGSDVVDWGRDGRHRLIYPLRFPSPAHDASVAGLPTVTAIPKKDPLPPGGGGLGWGEHGRPSTTPSQTTNTPAPALPHLVDYWQPHLDRLRHQLLADGLASAHGNDSADLPNALRLVSQLDRKADELREAVIAGPRAVDHPRARWIETLAGYLRPLADELRETVAGGDFMASGNSAVAVVRQSLSGQIENLLSKIDDVMRHAWDRRLFWAVADAGQIRTHHLVGIRRTLELLAPPCAAVGAGERSCRASDPAIAPRLIAEQSSRERRVLRVCVGRRLDRAFSLSQWRALDRGEPLSARQSRTLAELFEGVGQAVPDVEMRETVRLSLTYPAGSAVHSLARKTLLEELAKRDPALAFSMSGRLLARDALHLAGAEPDRRPPPGATAVMALEGPVEWIADDEGATLSGEKTFVPAVGADWFVLLVGNRLVTLDRRTPGLRVERLGTLGLRGSEPSRLVLDAVPVPTTSVLLSDDEPLRRRLTMLACADTLSIALGMAETLSRRAIEHATGRIQFPGLFHDESARDGIGKFGAVKQMVAQIEARRFLLETLSYDADAFTLDDSSYEALGAAKAVAAEALGTSPGSITYNAGQIFGGTGFSEDDVLAKFYRDASVLRQTLPANVDVLAETAVRLASNPENAEWEELAGASPVVATLRQRKALQPELDALRHAHQDLTAAISKRRDAVSLDEARCRLEIAATGQVLARVHARLEAGIDAEGPVELVNVLIAELTDQAQSLRRRAEHRAHASETGPEGPRVAASPDAAADRAVSSYEELLAAPAAYDFGDFLLRPLDVTEPVYTPEMTVTDERLAQYDRTLYERLHQRFGSRTFDGLPYDRHLEKQHRMSAEDLAYLTRHGFFRMPIPTALGGEGRAKADYYLLIKHALQQGDVSLALTIQANTSIGTTPALLALAHELPRAEADLQTWLQNPDSEAAYRSRIAELVALLDQPDPRRLEKPFRALADDVQRELAGPAVVRSVFARFLEEFQSAALAGRRRDLEGFARHLKACAAAFESDAQRARPLLEELGRRRTACKQFLSWIAAGHISAFALTEPSAGSDTARIATRAVARSAEVHVRPDGMLTFRPDGADEERVLLDAARLVFSVPETAGGSADGAARTAGQSSSGTQAGQAGSGTRAGHFGNGVATVEAGGGARVWYRWSDEQPPSEICFDEYDYESDDPLARRYYDHGGRKVYFTDVAQIRRRDGRLYYDYWQLDGAKMWITNGRLAGVMVLYAKTGAGVTAFLVDRHAEGLVVGKDEEKMGQCGSPTNELSLTAVRVPYENVAGLEGRGQVNALETLNVGRAGLAVSAVSLMGQLIDEADEFARRRWQRPPRWVDEALDQMRDDQFACESLAYELIGRFDHPGTHSVRMESAIAKMAVSETLHAMIEQAEDVYGLLGQTRALRIEKHKRDARILNIYEGTNEVQRFFILKDLINEIAPRARALVSSPPPTGGGGLGWGARPDSLCSVHSALEPCVEPFEANRRALLERLEAAVERFGRDGWLNPNLQPSLFTLSEAASWLLMWASSLRRSHQLLTGESDPAERAPILDRAARLTARIHDQVLTALGRFDEDFDALGHGFYPPVIRAAELAFEPGRREPASERPTSATGARRWAGAKRNVVVVVEPRPELSPEPVISDGRIDEVYYRLGAADSAALDAALDLAHTSNVHVTVAAVGPRRADAVLREALARGADEALLVVAPYEPTDPAAACEALATALADDERAVDLLLSRPPSASGEVGWSGVLLAARLGIPWYGTRQGIDLDDSAAGNEALLVRDAGDARAIDASATERAALPIACAVEIAGESPREFTTTGWLDSLRRPLRYAAWPAEVPLPDSRVRLAHRSSADLAEQDGKGGQAAHATRVSTPDEAAAHFLEIAGVHGPTGPAVFASSLTLPSPNGRGVGGEGGRTEADGGAAPEGGEATWHVRESDFDLVNPLGEIDEPCAVAILVADRHGKFASGEQSVLTAVARVAREWKLRAAALVLGSGGTDAEAQVGRHLAASRIDLAWIWRHRHFSPDLPELCRRALESGWQTPPRLRVVVAASWAAESLALLARGGDASAYGVPPAIGFGVSHLEVDGTSITVEAPWGAGRLVRSSRRGLDEGSPIWLGVSPAFEAPRLPAPLVGRSPLAPAALWASDIPLEDWFSRDVVARAARESRQHSGERSGLAHADVIVDVGAGIRNRDCLDEVIEPLVRALKRLGIGSVEVGGSRKVVEELGLLPADRQIGQTGQSVNPKLLLAVGISGAPQHLDYIGPRATVFSFNRDPEAPIMTLNRRAPRPRVVPIVGDLFETVPDFIRTLARRAGASAPDHHEIGKRADNVDEPTKVALG